MYRRLRWLQSIGKFYDDHIGVLAALTSSTMMAPQQLDDSGYPIIGANPFVSNFFHDMISLTEALKKAGMLLMTMELQIIVIHYC